MPNVIQISLHWLPSCVNGSSMRVPEESWELTLWLTADEGCQVLSHWMFSNDRQFNNLINLKIYFSHVPFLGRPFIDYLFSVLQWNEVWVFKDGLEKCFQFIKVYVVPEYVLFLPENTRWHYKRHMWQTVRDSKSLIFFFLFACKKYSLIRYR